MTRWLWCIVVALYLVFLVCDIMTGAPTFEHEVLMMLALVLAKLDAMEGGLVAVASDEKRREVAAKLRNVFAPYGVPKGRYISLPDVLDAVGIYYDEDVDVDAVTDVKDVCRLVDLINRPTCCDLVEHKPDPFVPGKRMTDGVFHCSGCGWHGRIYEYIGFGDMVAYEAVFCPKCGEEIER